MTGYEPIASTSERTIALSRRQRRSGLLGHILSFTLGAVSFLEFPVVGRLFATEILLAVVLFALLPSRDSVLKRPLTRAFLSLAMTWFLGQAATDVIRGTDFTDSAKGAAKVVFTVINLLGLYLLLERHQIRLTLYVFGLGAGQFVKFFVNPHPDVAVDTWKWGLGWPT